MADKKTIGISGILAILLSVGILVTPGFFEEDKYFCESRPELGAVHCDSFSKYVDVNGKCVRDEDTNLICRDGWKQILNDTQIPDEEDNKNPVITGADKVRCNMNGCEDI